MFYLLFSLVFLISLFRFSSRCSHICSHISSLFSPFAMAVFHLPLRACCSIGTVRFHSSLCSLRSSLSSLVLFLCILLSSLFSVLFSLLLQWLSFTCRYVPVGLLQQYNFAPTSFLFYFFISAPLSLLSTLIFALCSLVSSRALALFYFPLRFCWYVRAAKRYEE
jgi:hypothetical protein